MNSHTELLFTHLASQLEACKLGNPTSCPAWLRDDGLGTGEDGSQRRPNLSGAARRYLDTLGMGVEDLFHHALAVLHDPAYRQANAGALRMEWPRIPLPGWPDPSSSVQRGCRACRIRRPRTRARPPARPRNSPRPRRHHRRAAPGDRRHSRALHRRRPQHVRRRLRADRRLGTLRSQARPSCPARAASSNAPTPTTNSRT